MSLHFVSIVYAQKFTININDAFLLKMGVGVNYGGLGFNTEFRKNDISGNVILGYSPSYMINSSVILPATNNFAIQGLYYFRNITKIVQPNAGLHIGWLTNYYVDRIGTDAYNPVVYGVAPIAGLKINMKYFFIDLSMLIDHIFVFKKQSHPYFNSGIAFGPSFGLGLNLLYFFKKKKEEKKEEHISTPSY